ncbi:ABC transporter permease [Nocardioides endophyticus]|uniref:ABC transporter permease n=1 Tax=Nocardioides endophyticus TaxID=1353775 RepID=A0ABP8YV25_9ACTN
MSSATFRRRPAGTTVLGGAGVLLTLALWEALPASGLVSANEIPGALAVLDSLAALVGTGDFWRAVGATLAGAGLGLGIAVAIGVAVGTLMGSIGIVRNALTPTVEFLRPVPGVALIPVAMLMFGPGLTSDVVLVTFGCVWVVIVQTQYGVRAADPVALQTAESFRMSRWARIRFVQVPSSLPFIATGVRIASSIALIVAVTAELISGNTGVGDSIAFAQSAARTEDMYAYIITAGILGVLAHLAFGGIERRLLHWHQSQRTGA